MIHGMSRTQRITSFSTSNSGRTLGRFVIQAELGRGAMGVVYKAFDPMVQRPVAIKVILDPSATSDDLRRFHREAVAPGRLRHSGIVTFLEVGNHESRPL